MSEVQSYARLRLVPILWGDPGRNATMFSQCYLQGMLERVQLVLGKRVRREAVAKDRSKLPIDKCDWFEEGQRDAV